MHSSQLRIIGIDPGAHGALAFITHNGQAITHATATTAPKDALMDAISGVALTDCVAYLERVGGYIAGQKLPGSAMFKMGYSAGYWEGALAALGVRTILVRPQDWQAGLPNVAGHKEKADRKRALKAEAIRRFPTLSGITLDTCDALLIADYGRRQETKA